MKNAEIAKVHSAKEILRKVGRSIGAVASAVRTWWENGNSYQHRAYGWAVTGFVLCLLNLFTVGLLPVMSYLAIACCAVALFRGNRALISPLGIALGVVGLILSQRVYHAVSLYATDADAFRQVLTDAMTKVQSTIAGLV